MATTRSLILAACLGGCAQIVPPAPSESGAGLRPDIAPPPPAGAASAEEFDTTSAAARQAAAFSPADAAPGIELGRAIASLGNPADPGFWARTALVTEAGPGRLYYPAAGTSVRVDLRPLEGAGATQVSLPALRLLGAPLTALPEIIVFALPPVPG